MIRICIACMVSLLMTVNTGALESTRQLDSREMTFIGRSYAEVKKDLKAIKGVNIIHQGGIVRDLFIKTDELSVDGIRVGDSIEKVKRIYPKEWVHEYDTGLIVLKGATSHYNVVTHYIAYLKQGNTICEIQLGNTAAFTRVPLPISNSEAHEKLEGKWISDTGRILKFDKQALEDNLMDALYDNQSYRVIAPNELTIYSYMDNIICKSNIKFWIDRDTLYLFKANNLGIPIKETIECFTKV